MEQKPGFKTSEFWLGVASFLTGALMASGMIGDGNAVLQLVGGLCMALSPAAYSVGRGLAKKP